LVFQGFVQDVEDRFFGRPSLTLKAVISLWHDLCLQSRYLSNVMLPKTYLDLSDSLSS